MRRLTAPIAGLLVLGLLVVPGVAGAGEKGNGKAHGKGASTTSTEASSIEPNQAAPVFGDTVTFTTSHPDIPDVGRIWLRCYQNSEWVYQWAATESEAFRLWGGSWTAGAATITAELYYFEYKGQKQVARVTLADTTFGVGA